MLVRHKKTMNIGGLLALTFVGILLLIFSPVFGNGHNGLEYSDALFNKLAKGSSYFIPKLAKEVKELDGKQFDVALKMEKPEQAVIATKLFTAAGAQASSQGAELKISGNLGQVLASVLQDSDAMYHDKGSVISTRYGVDEKEAMATWWSALNKIVKEFQKSKKAEQATMISEVMKKGIEPAYNFYGIESQKISEKAFTVLGLLLFYILYTMWWGYAIFNIFDGLGLSMKKAKVKQEV